MLILTSLFLFTLLLNRSLEAKVFVNQQGYLPDQLKMAYTDHAVDWFAVIDMTTEQTVFQGSVILRKTDDPSTGLDVYLADFSSLKKPGQYKIRLSDGQESVPFTIADSIFAQVAQKTLKGLYFQRCGQALTEPFAEPYVHGACHSADALFHSSCQASGYSNTRGGWHDAGDYGKYVVPAANALSYMLMLAEYFPQFLSSDHLNIPESGNGQPDLLDEARYELQWLLTMQDSTSGGVYFKVTTKDFVGFIMPDDSYEARYIYQIASTATADFSAIMARAARVYESYDSSFAKQCLNAARKAWQWLQQNPNIVPAGGFHNPDDTETGEYGDSDDRDERLWAAAELFETTGEAQFNSYFLNHYQDSGIITGPAGWQYVKPLAQITYLRSKQSAASSKARNNIRSALQQFAADQVTISEQDGFHVCLEGWEYYWGSNSVALNKAIILIFMYEEMQDKRYFDVALHQLNYILGCNAHNMTFVTDVGTKKPMHIHHAPSLADEIEDPVPGLMAGGPNRYLDDPALQAHFNSNTPPALCYLDDQESYASNEIAIYWNTPLMFVSTYFNQGNGNTSLIPRATVTSSFELLQNYPNPFNGQTVISFNLDTIQRVKLTIYDVQGRQVLRLYSGLAGPGKISLLWRGHDDNGQAVSSGIYYYRIEIGSKQRTQKMVLLR